MALSKTKPQADQLYRCVESFASSQDFGRCAEGARLLGSHPTVQGWPQYFIPADRPDDEAAAAREDHYR
jgi:hypothetical protein